MFVGASHLLRYYHKVKQELYVLTISSTLICFICVITYPFFSILQVRLKGNLAYQGSSGTYKSKKRRILSANFDSHYWPFCKEQGNEHNAARLVLTQIICGDTLKDMYDQVHEMTKKCNINLDCNCCNDKKAKLDKKASKSQNAQKVEKIEIKVNHYYCFVCFFHSKCSDALLVII